MEKGTIYLNLRKKLSKLCMKIKLPGEEEVAGTSVLYTVQKGSYLKGQSHEKVCEIMT
jgi:hypothetical protein